MIRNVFGTALPENLKKIFIHIVRNNLKIVSFRHSRPKTVKKKKRVKFDDTRGNV
jgi:hypothetical protein